MSDDGKKPKQTFRRFRIARKVKEPEYYSEQVMREVEQDTADHGTPAMDREVSKGCMGCLRVTLLFFLIILASIIATWFIRKHGV
jgi:hypothetical protein